MHKIRLISDYSEEAACLKDHFLKTFQDDWELRISFCGKIGGGGDYGTPSFVGLNRKKIELIAESVKNYQGDILIWSDLDIQFFGKCERLLLQALKNKDIVFQAEHWPQKNINAGFIAMRCNPATAAFFNAVLALNFERYPEKFVYWDQSAIEHCLQDKALKVKWGVLPWQFWARSHGWPPPRGIVLHHANCTEPITRNGQKVGSLALKFEQLEEVRRYMEEYSKQPFMVSLKARARGFLSRRKALLKYRLKRLCKAVLS